MFNDKEKDVVYIGSDHAGFKLKEVLKGHLEGKGVRVADLGCFSEEPCDYPDIAREVGEKVIEHKEARAVVICGSGIGISIGINRFKDVRAANCVTAEMAEMARKHNDANVLALGSRIVSEEDAKGIVDKFFDVEFEGKEEGDNARHLRRVDKLKSIG